ncbi:hypothetical protein LEP1GSC185_0568 [Leptospira licerasiae serovar Varillal str. VAR 010]|nr:hypothetical protein LEP1GSC185_0568 [Leptospira licerasiae serovar Varillal str. VAR 010]
MQPLLFCLFNSNGVIRIYEWPRGFGQYCSTSKNEKTTQS